MVLRLATGCETNSSSVKLTCVRCHGTGWQESRLDNGIGSIGGSRQYAIKSGPCRWCFGEGYIIMGAMLSRENLKQWRSMKNDTSSTN